MGKLCVIYNFAPRYREGIFKMMDQEYDCDWFFGDNRSDIKGLDITLLQRVGMLKNRTIICPPFYYQKGVQVLLKNRIYSTYLILGDIFCLSTWLFVIKARLFYPHKKIYFWSHGWYGKENYLKVFIKKIYFHLVDGIFLYGNYAKKLMLKEGFDSMKLFVVHNSLMYGEQKALRNSLSLSNIYRNHFNNDGKNLIFIGRLTVVKQLDLLIEALAILKKSNYCVNLTIIGDGIQKESLERLVLEKHLCDHVWFYGACYNEYINAELIFNADLCIAPGNIGLTAIHSMTFGTPVATHNCFKYQMPEFEAIHPETTGTFFDYGSANSIANCIVEWFKKHHDDREVIRNNCYKEIDSCWTPQYQISVIKQNLIIR